MKTLILMLSMLAVIATGIITLEKVPLPDDVPPSYTLNSDLPEGNYLVLGQSEQAESITYEQAKDVFETDHITFLVMEAKSITYEQAKDVIPISSIDNYSNAKMKENGYNVNKLTSHTMAPDKMIDLHYDPGSCVSLDKVV